MKYLLLPISLFLLLACSQSKNVTPANQFVGTWRLTTYCKPTSGSACTLVTIPAGKNVYIFFGNDGKFNETYENTKPVEYGFLGCGSGDYSIEGDKVRIRALCMSSSNGKLYNIVSIGTHQLVQNPFGTGEYVFIRQ